MELRRRFRQWIQSLNPHPFTIHTFFFI
jgi:hypothetical protein